MDPLSMTAAIITVLELTERLTSSMKHIINASSEQKKVAIEASNVYNLLLNLRFRVEEAEQAAKAGLSDPWFNRVKLLGVEGGPLDQLKKCLEQLVKETVPTKKRDQIKSALKGEFRKAEIDKNLQQMERLTTLVNCALTGDVMTLSRAIQDDVAFTRTAVTALGDQMQQLQIGAQQVQNHIDHEWQNRLKDWLRIPDPSTNYQSALQKRCPHTGSWLVDGQRFRDWQTSTAPLMWLHVQAGCGKTVLSAVALHGLLANRLSEPETAVIYFYFDFQDAGKLSTTQAIRSLLLQLAQAHPAGLQNVRQLYERCEKGQRQPSEDIVRSLLKESMSQMKSTYIVLDALDECDDRGHLLNFIQELNDCHILGLHMLVTSRREKDIEEVLKPISVPEINIQSSIVDQDINLYVQNWLATEPGLKKWSNGTRTEISDTLIAKANGMFRWVHCQLEPLRTCKRLGQLRKVLTTLPPTLNDTYERILQGLDAEGQLQDAITVLRWLCHSKKPLNLSQVVEVLAIDNGEGGGFSSEERLPDPNDIMSICSSMITCVSIKSDNRVLDFTSDTAASPSCDSDEDDSISSSESILYTTQWHTVQVRLAHFSVKQYLLSDRCSYRKEIMDHQQITENCLHYLLHLSKHVPLNYRIVAQYPLARYAATHWWEHLHDAAGSVEPMVLGLALKFFVDKSDALLAWAQLSPLLSEIIRPRFSPERSKLNHPIYYAALVGFEEAVNTFLQEEVDMDALSDAMDAASMMGYTNVVRMLLDASANVDAGSGYFDCALRVASEYGHTEIVRELLARGADVDTNVAEPPLQSASGEGHLDVVRILMEAGADVNLTSRSGGTALQDACCGGHLAIARLLIQRGADVNAQGHPFVNALEATATNQSPETARMLLDEGANVHVQGGTYGNVLQAACYYESTKMVEMLLEQGVDVKAQGGYYGTALQAASCRGNAAIARLLLDRGADVDIQGGYYGTALQAASYSGNTATVMLLLDHGADVGVQCGYHGTALQAASHNGGTATVQLLLDNGADVNIQGGHSGTALQAASTRQDPEIARLLLDHGADIYHQGGFFGSALQAACYMRRPETVRLLLKRGADVNAQAGVYGTALQIAQRHEQVEIVQLLLNAGAMRSRVL